MPVTAGTVMTQAATHLNDPSQLLYTSGVLLPYLQMAVQELEEEMAVHELSPLKKDSIDIAVPADSTFLASMPVDFVEMIAMFERPSGSEEIYQEVRGVKEIDINLTVQKDTQIIQYTTRGSIIYINPPSSDREVQIDYIRGLVEPAGTGTALDIDSSRRFLALLTARNAARDAGNSSSKANAYNEDIGRARDRLLRRLQKSDQNPMGVRRIGYSGRRYY